MRNRRRFVIVLGANALIASFGAFSQQQEKVRRIGVIGSPPIGRPNRYFTTFREELHRLGYVDGKTLVIDYRSAEGRLDQIPGLVQELIKSKVDVLVVYNVVAIRAAYRASQTIPIVMATSLDPVAAGFVQSLRQPGGNVTGVSTLTTELSAKRIELLQELIPGISRVAVLWDPQGPGPQQRFRDYSAAAKTLKLDILSLEVKGQPSDFENAFQTARSNQAQGLIVVSNPTISPYRDAVVRDCRSLSVRSGSDFYMQTRARHCQPMRSRMCSPRTRSSR